MFVEGGGGWRPTWEPPPRRPRLTRQQEQRIVWLVAFCALLLLIAPIGGATIIEAGVAVLAGH